MSKEEAEAKVEANRDLILNCKSINQLFNASTRLFITLNLAYRWSPLVLRGVPEGGGVNVLSSGFRGSCFGRRFNHSTIDTLTTLPRLETGDCWLETIQPLAYCFCSFVLYALPYRTNAYFFPLLWSFQKLRSNWMQVPPRRANTSISICAGTMPNTHIWPDHGVV